MIPARAAFLAVAVLLAPARAGAETQFLAAFADVPLAPGLAEQGTAAFAFTGQEGRIAETVASGRGQSARRARDYYLEALPALGWALQPASGDLVFLRGRERLTLAFADGSDGALTVHFRLVVRPASLALD